VPRSVRKQTVKPRPSCKKKKPTRLDARLSLCGARRKKKTPAKTDHSARASRGLRREETEPERTHLKKKKKKNASGQSSNGPAYFTGVYVAVRPVSPAIITREGKGKLIKVNRKGRIGYLGRLSVWCKNHRKRVESRPFDERSFTRDLYQPL